MKIQNSLSMSIIVRSWTKSNMPPLQPYAEFNSRTADEIWYERYTIGCYQKFILYDFPVCSISDDVLCAVKFLCFRYGFYSYCVIILTGFFMLLNEVVLFKTVLWDFVHHPNIKRKTIGRKLQGCFYDAFIIAEHITSNGRMTDELETIWKETVVA
jgi:hypothetical protein